MVHCFRGLLRFLLCMYLIFLAYLQYFSFSLILVYLSKVKIKFTLHVWIYFISICYCILELIKTDDYSAFIVSFEISNGRWQLCFPLSEVFCPCYLSYFSIQILEYAHQYLQKVLSMFLLELCWIYRMIWSWIIY